MVRSFRIFFVVLLAMSAAVAFGQGKNKVTLRLNQFQGSPHFQFYQEFADSYTKNVNPNVRIEVERVGGENYWTSLKTIIASGDIPDIVGITAWTMVGDYASSGYAVDLSKQEWLNRFAPSALEAVKYDGKTYAVPKAMQAMGIIYNKKIFKDLGIQPPETISALRLAVEKIKKAGIIPFAAAYKDAWTLRQWFSIGHTPTVKSVSEFVSAMNKGTINTFYSPKMESVFDVFDLINSNTFAKPFDVDFQSACSELSQGKVAMFLQGNWVLSVTQAIDPELDFGMFAMPISEKAGEGKISADFGQVFYVSAKNPHQKESIDFLKWLCSDPDVAKRWSDAVGEISGVKGAVAPTSMGNVGVDIANAIKNNAICPWGFAIWPTGFDVDVQQAMQVYFQNSNRKKFFKTIDEAYMKYR